MADLPPLRPEDLGEEFRAKIALQDYSARPTIEGVQFIPLRAFPEDGGSFMEVCRLDEQGCLEALPSFRVLQVSHSEMEPGAVKAWHLHLNQEDVWFVAPSQRALVGLLDLRKTSPSYQVAMRFVLGAGNARLLYVPRGVAHGAANLSQHTISLLYLTNQHFNPDHPDEHRLPWDLLGGEFWEMHRG